MKLGNTCHISTLPEDVYPADLAIGIQEIKTGNDVTTEEDEVLKHAILLDDESPLTAAEKRALHSDIKKRCLDSSLNRCVGTSITESQSEDLKNGKIIDLNSKFVVSLNYGNWRYPNRASATLWVRETIHSIVRVSCCQNPPGDPTYCQDNYPETKRCSKFDLYKLVK